MQNLLVDRNQVNISRLTLHFQAWGRTYSGHEKREMPDPSLDIKDKVLRTHWFSMNYVYYIVFLWIHPPKSYTFYPKSNTKSIKTFEQNWGI